MESDLYFLVMNLLHRNVKWQQRLMFSTSNTRVPYRTWLFHWKSPRCWLNHLLSGCWNQDHVIFGGSKITADGDCSHEIKGCLLLGRKVMTNLDSICKSRDITLPTRIHLVKAMVFPVVMYGCESWTVKKAECQRIDAFKLWCWRRLLIVPWTARRSNQSIMKEINPGISLEGMMLKLKLSTLATSCEELTHWKRLWCWEGLGAVGEGDDWGWDGWMASRTRWTWVWVNSGRWWWTGRPGVLRFMGSQRVGHDWATELNWIESNCQHLLDHGKSKRVPEKHLFLLYWRCQSLWLCGSQ